MKKVLLVTNIPTPYRVPLFELLDRQFRENGWHLHVVFCSSTYRRRKFEMDAANFKFQHSFLNGGTINSRENTESTYFLYRGLWKTLVKEKPDHIIVSGFSAATFQIYFWKLIHGTTFTIWSGTIAQRKKTSSFIRQISRKTIAAFADSFIAYGMLARDYLTGIGVHPNKITIATNTVDTGFFKSKTEEERLKVQNTSRPFTFTFIGYLVSRKEVDKIIDAASALSGNEIDYRILIIGDGEMKQMLEMKAQLAGQDKRIRFEGYKQKNELPAYLAQTDVFLFQTGFDIWGLVLNEAMAAGLPCIASTKAGATFDLIKNGETGFAVDFNETRQLTELMKWCMHHPESIREMGERASSYIIEHASLEGCARSFVNNINSIPSKK